MAPVLHLLRAVWVPGIVLLASLARCSGTLQPIQPDVSTSSPGSNAANPNVSDPRDRWIVIWKPDISPKLLQQVCNALNSDDLFDGNCTQQYSKLLRGFAGTFSKSALQSFLVKYKGLVDYVEQDAPVQATDIGLSIPPGFQPFSVAGVNEGSAQPQQQQRADGRHRRLHQQGSVSTPAAADSGEAGIPTAAASHEFAAEIHLPDVTAGIAAALNGELEAALTRLQQYVLATVQGGPGGHAVAPGNAAPVDVSSASVPPADVSGGDDPGLFGRLVVNASTGAEGPVPSPLLNYGHNAAVGADIVPDSADAGASPGAEDGGKVARGLLGVVESSDNASAAQQGAVTAPGNVVEARGDGIGAEQKGVQASDRKPDAEVHAQAEDVTAGDGGTAEVAGVAGDAAQCGSGGWNGPTESVGHSSGPWAGAVANLLMSSEMPGSQNQGGSCSSAAAGGAGCSGCAQVHRGLLGAPQPGNGSLPGLQGAAVNVSQIAAMNNNQGAAADGSLQGSAVNGSQGSAVNGSQGTAVKSSQGAAVNGSLPGWQGAAVDSSQAAALKHPPPAPATVPARKPSPAPPPTPSPPVPANATTRPAPANSTNSSTIHAPPARQICPHPCGGPCISMDTADIFPGLPTNFSLPQHPAQDGRNLSDPTGFMLGYAETPDYSSNDAESPDYTDDGEPFLHWPPSRPLPDTYKGPPSGFHTPQHAAGRGVKLPEDYLPGDAGGNSTTNGTNVTLPAGRKLPEQLNPDWGLDMVDQADLPLDHKFIYNFTGQGVNVYVLDSGIRISHDEFRIGQTNSSRARYAWSAFDRPPNDCFWHGTHVSAIIGGKTFGVAKNATLYAVQVLDCAGFSTVSNILQGLEWVAANAVQPAVVHMSIRGDYNTAINDAVESLVNNNKIHVVVSAGNENMDACNVSPGSASSAITVGAVDQDADRWWNSNWGPCLDIFAPGFNISSALPTSDSASARRSGTSMAAPFVTGVVAMYLQRNPGASDKEVLQKLIQASSIGTVGNDRYGLASLTAAAGMRDISSTPNRLLDSNLFPQAILTPSIIRISGNTTTPRLVLRVQLTSPPQHYVTVYLTAPPAWDGSPHATLTPTALGFQPSNWNISKAVVVQVANIPQGAFFISLLFRSQDRRFDGGLQTVKVLDSRTVVGETAAAPRVVRSLPFKSMDDSSLFSNQYECDPSSPDHSPDVVYAYTAPQDMDVDISTCGSMFDTKLLVASDLGDMATYICNDDDRNCGLNPQNSRVSTSLQAGTTYYIVVGGYSGAEGVFQLSINCTSCPQDAPITQL